jgi:hypothetical protein
VLHGLQVHLRLGYGQYFRLPCQLLYEIENLTGDYGETECYSKEKALERDIRDDDFCSVLHYKSIFYGLRLRLSSGYVLRGLSLRRHFGRGQMLHFHHPVHP